MSLPIAIPRARRNDADIDSTSPCSSYGGLSTSSSWTPSGVYVPVHKRRSAASSATSSAVSSPGKSAVPLPSVGSHAPLIYTRDTLLQLAKSPLSLPFSPPTLDLHAAFPSIIREHGNEIQRALEMAGKPNSRFQTKRMRARRGAGAPSGTGASEAEESSEATATAIAMPTPNGSDRRERWSKPKGRTSSGNSNSNSNSPKPKHHHKRRDASVGGSSSEGSWRSPQPQRVL